MDERIVKRKSRKLLIIRRFFTGAKKYFVAAVIASFLTTILNALTPQIFRFTIDSVLSGKAYPYLSEHLWMIALVLVVVALLSGAAMFVSRYFTARAGENFAENMRNALFAHVQKLPMSWHDKNQTGDIIQRCTSDVEVIRNFVVTQFLEVFRTVFLIVVSFSMMISMNVKLSLIVLLFVPVVAAYSGIFYRLIASRFQYADEAEGELSTVVQENATGVRVVRAFGREKFEMERFREKNNAFAKLWIRLGSLSGLYWGIGDLITGFQVITVIVLGAAEAVHGNISVGEFIAFASYNTTLVWPIRGLGRILSDMSKAGVSFERVDYIIGGKEEAYGAKDVSKNVQDSPNDLFKDVQNSLRNEQNSLKNIQDSSESVQNSFAPDQYSIRFSHVNFAYENGEAVLKDINFDIPQGATFGILGGTGSGKSTVVQLLDRFYELADGQGAITIGGKNIKDIPLEQLRRDVAIVLQEPFLYSRTIRENIAAANPDASLEEIRSAAKVACVDDAIMSFPDGYDTLVGERGVTLSGGQRQRVAIARMLLQKAPIMVFDDSLSAVDSETDSLIRKALKEHMKDATVILISHRITTLMTADNIMVLSKGRIEEMGTHYELIEKDGIYRRIYNIQMSHDDRKEVNETHGSL
ncbi:ABC transporter ATP-binding protein/permease [Blautia schinkii]|nr:ABC transporter ATP-binding protein/permease [Blautia schinkii]